MLPLIGRASHKWLLRRPSRVLTKRYKRISYFATTFWWLILEIYITHLCFMSKSSVLAASLAEEIYSPTSSSISVCSSFRKREVSVDFPVLKLATSLYLLGTVDWPHGVSPACGTATPQWIPPSCIFKKIISFTARHELWRTTASLKNYLHRIHCRMICVQKVSVVSHAYLDAIP